MREAVNGWPSTDQQRNDLWFAIEEFERLLPGWWWSTAACSVSRDASCAPDRTGPDAHLLEERLFDEGFHCDDREGTCADALRTVMREALEAKAAWMPAPQKQGEGVMGFVSATLVANFVSILSVLAAATLAYNRIEGWGWFLLIAALTSATVSWKSKSDDP